MAEGDRKKKAASSRSSTTASRAAQRRVKLPESSASTPPPARVVRPPRPFWKKGGFWFAVILAEAIGAVGLSYVFALDPEAISLDGGDRAAFCQQVRTYQAEGVVGTTPLELANVHREFEHQSVGYRKLAGVAPDAVRSDFEKAANLTDELIVYIDDVVRHQAADPAYLDAMADIAKKQGELSARAYGVIERINAVILRACNIDINAPPAPTTTVSPTTVAANPGGSTPPGSAPAGSVPPTTGG